MGWFQGDPKHCSTGGRSSPLGKVTRTGPEQNLELWRPLGQRPGHPLRTLEAVKGHFTLTFWCPAQGICEGAIVKTHPKGIYDIDRDLRVIKPVRKGEFP